MIKLARYTTYDSGNSVVAEDILWSSYFETRSVVARNRLVLFYAPLVKTTAERIAARVSQIGTLDDLCQMGVVGLIDAVERFDPSDGFKFTTYAGHRIKGAIFDGMRALDVLPKKKRAAVNSFYGARETLAAVFHRPPTVEETADHLGKSVSDVVNLAIWASRGSVMASLSLLDPVEGLEEAVDYSSDPAETVAKEWTRETVKTALKALPERQRHAVVLYYMEGFAKSKVAEILGVDRSRVTQLLSQGERNLRALMERTEFGFQC